MPIRWRLVLVSLGLLTLLFSAMGVVISMVAEQNLLVDEARVLHNEAQLATKGPKNAPFQLYHDFLPAANPPVGFNTSATNLVHRLTSPSTDATVLSTDGKTLIASEQLSFAPQAITVAPDSVLQELNEDDPNTAYVVAKNTAGRQLIIFIPLVYDNHTVGILQLGTPTSSIDAFLSSLHLMLFFGVVISLVLAAVLTFPLMSVALQPLVAIERASRRIAKGEFSARIDPPVTNDEVGQLAISFNQMVKQLDATFQRQRQFVADVSHELRTPLTALGGSLEMLLIGADKGDIEASRRLTRGMYSEVQRMQRLVEDLLVDTKLDAGRVELHMGAIDMQAYMHSIEGQVHHLAHGQIFSYNLAAGTPFVHADGDRLQQVLLNIIDNALKFTADTGKVECRVYSEEAETVRIEVRDNGKGISAEDLPYIFDRFYRVDSSRSRSSEQVGGSGLGLAIAKKLIEAQGGTITVESVLHEGTTVIIQLPAEVVAQGVVVEK